MTWAPYRNDDEIELEHQDLLETQANKVEARIGELLKQLELYDSPDFAFYQLSLNAWMQRIKDEAIALRDPIDIAEKRATYQVLAHLASLPERTRIEIESLRVELNDLRGPQARDTL